MDINGRIALAVLSIQLLASTCTGIFLAIRISKDEKYANAFFEDIGELPPNQRKAGFAIKLIFFIVLWPYSLYHYYKKN